jgi:hypothetical protein
MADESKEPKDGNNKSGSAKQSRQEYDRLVQGVDDIYFGGLDEPQVEQTPPLETPPKETPKCDDDAK